jgi:tRNA threonylcarbamoyladenosine biosynthesis protein TsaE
VKPAPDIRLTTSSARATQAFAAALAPFVTDGDLLVLVGDLGAGKTAFTQGLCAALGVEDLVTSPTFTLANRYEGRLVVNHLDVYRIEALAEAEDLAIPELLDDGLTVIEWGDVFLPDLPDDRLELCITFGAGDDDRVIELSAVGLGWTERLGLLEHSLREWVAA